MSVSHPNVLIIDAGDTAGLDFMTRHYRGYMEFDWLPCRVIGVTGEERSRFLGNPDPGGV
jgi:hypothetical protein